MFINRVTDYALRILRVLKDNESHSTYFIANDQGIPHAYCYKIIKKLSKIGLVRIYRGASGGCALNCDLQKFTLYDLMICVEERTDFISCSSSCFICDYREEHGNCDVHDRLSVIQNNLINELKSYTLQDVLFGG